MQMDGGIVICVHRIAGILAASRHYKQGGLVDCISGYTEHCMCISSMCVQARPCQSMHCAINTSTAGGGLLRLNLGDLAVRHAQHIQQTAKARLQSKA